MVKKFHDEQYQSYKIGLEDLESIFLQYLSLETMYGFDGMTIEPHLEQLLDAIVKEMEDKKEYKEKLEDGK